MTEAALCSHSSLQYFRTETMQVSNSGLECQKFPTCTGYTMHGHYLTNALCQPPKSIKPQQTTVQVFAFFPSTTCTDSKAIKSDYIRGQSSSLHQSNHNLSSLMTHYYAFLKLFTTTSSTALILKWPNVPAMFFLSV